MAIALLGSTGSIGEQTLSVAAELHLPIYGLGARSNVRRMEEQARAFHPTLAVLADETAAKELRLRLADTAVKVYGGSEALEALAAAPEADTVLAAMSGEAGLRPAFAAARAGKRLALANKETLVCAGRLLLREVQAGGAELLPVDSEHSAIFQCLQNNPPPRRLLLTASGGPFREFTAEQLRDVTPAAALRHPNWSMGRKITVDSASLMNKGLEFIEAMHLFSVTPEQITVLVHPQSIVHSAVEFEDGAVIAQLGTPDMRLPIQLALTWPERLPCIAPRLDLTGTPPLSFSEPDLERFPCLRIAMEVAGRENADAAVMNGANEVAVAAFLAGKLRFMGIPALVERVLSRISGLPANTTEEVEYADREARRIGEECLSHIS